jgi:hypothetical protein
MRLRVQQRKLETHDERRGNDETKEEADETGKETAQSRSA